ncbi:MAG TPA: EAL domain-containing protein [Xanthobacteraceae bacterium]|nr:EAL domain-containing protein [Xanthobacteraceae bacterium]
MARLYAVFIAVCMVLIAGSVGAVLYLYYGFLRIEAAVIAVAVLTGLALFNAVSARARDRADVGDQIADLSRGTADLARQVADIGRRLSAVETEVARSPDKVRAAADPLSVEIGVLGGLVKELADSVAAHEAVLTGVARAPIAPAPAIAVPAPETAKTVDRAELGEPENDAARPAGGRFRGLTRGDVLALIRRAVEANRVDLYLQPIVTLPQRKVRYYEALARLRADDGDLLQPADFLDIAESGGLMPMIDNVMLFRCVQVVRRLAAKNREIGLFCNVAADTLVDSAYFPQFSEFMEANRALAAAIVFEFSQSSVRAMGPIEQESLAALAQLGFRFSMDRVTDLRIDPRELAARGFRFVKVPAALLLARAATTASDIHPADFSDLLGRFGIDLIAEKIESEGIVVDLLDFDVRFGQGFLFSPPRPVRAEVLQGLSDAPAAGSRRAPVLEAEAPRRGGEGQLVSRGSGGRNQDSGIRAQDSGIRSGQRAR